MLAGKLMDDSGGCKKVGIVPVAEACFVHHFPKESFGLSKDNTFTSNRKPCLKYAAALQYIFWTLQNMLPVGA